MIINNINNKYHQKCSPIKNRSNPRFPPQTFKIPSDQLLCKYLHTALHPSQTVARARVKPERDKEKSVNRKKPAKEKQRTRVETGTRD